MTKKYPKLFKVLILAAVTLASNSTKAQMWQHKSEMFNTSGIPSLSFSQPRFADLDADGDQDLILGTTKSSPLYFENIGSSASPKFQVANETLEVIEELDAEMAVPADIDADGDLDLITGGYTGLHLYKNTGNAENPSFEKVAGAFEKVSTSSNPIPSMADIDADGDLDLMVGLSEDGSIRIYTNVGNAETFAFSGTEFSVLDDVGLYAYPTFIDFDSDGDYDILTGRDGSGFYYYKNNGTVETPDWIQQNTTFSGMANSIYFNSPVCVDLDGDAKYEVVYGTADGPLSYYKNTSGTEYPNWVENNDLFGGILDVGGASAPIFVDYDGDDDLDLISGSNTGYIQYFENQGTKHTPKWKEMTKISTLKHSIYSSITMADVNNDGFHDALVGDISGDIYFHQATVNNFTSTSSSFDNVNLVGFSAPRLVDLNNDGLLDVVAGNEDGALFYFENTGEAENPVWTEISDYFATIEINGNSAPAFSDLNGDGDLDMLVGNLWGELRFFNNEQGTWIENDTLFAGIEMDQSATPTFADLDGDGDADLIIGDYDGTFEYYENQTITDFDTTTNIQPNTFIAGLKAYPNPFTSYIEFSLPDGNYDQVQISIFNILGKKVASKTQTYLSCRNSGIKISQLNNLPYGTYLYSIRLTGNDGNKTIKGKIVK